MSLYINEMHILDMRFAAHVSVAEFEQWLAHIQQYFEQKKFCADYANRAEY
jgi:hypothetical protein